MIQPTKKPYAAPPPAAWNAPSSEGLLPIKVASSAAKAPAKTYADQPAKNWLSVPSPWRVATRAA
jgi:hypothetical protein